MATFIYNEFKRAVLAGEIDLDAPNDIRVLLLMSNTTFGSQDDINTLGDVTTADYYDGTGHDSVNGHPLSGETIVEDVPNNWAEFDASDLTITALGAGTRQCVAILLFKWITTRDSSLPIAHIDNAPQLPFTGNGSDVTMAWNVEGILQQT